MVKLFTMHWPMIVTYWARELMAKNDGLDEASLVRAISVAFDFEDEGFGRDIKDYAYPAPQQRHRAGNNAQARKIRQAQAVAGDAAVILPSVHAYGPMDNVSERFRVGWETGRHGMWVNRYGYLVAEKLELLRSICT
jgi:hypothetical protein